MRSHYLGEWCYLTTLDSEHATKVKIEKIIKEVGNEAYVVVHTDGNRETIFANSVHRIYPVHQKKAKIIDFKKRREKRLKLVR